MAITLSALQPLLKLYRGKDLKQEISHFVKHLCYFTLNLVPSARALAVLVNHYWKCTNLVMGKADVSKIGSVQIGLLMNQDLMSSLTDRFDVPAVQ